MKRKLRKPLSERARIDIYPVIFLGIIFFATLSLTVGAEFLKLFGAEINEMHLLKLQIVVFILGTLLSFSGFIRPYLLKIYDIVYAIQDKHQKGDFGIDTRDNIYRMMAKSFERSVKLNHEICVTSFVKHDPTVISDVMRDYHKATRSLILSGEAVVKRIVVVEDINKLIWIERQIHDYTDAKINSNSAASLIQAIKNGCSEIQEKGRCIMKAISDDGLSPEVNKKISLRILLPALKFSSHRLMPINIELFSGEDVYIINPSMQGNETPVDACSYFLGNQENYLIYRGMFQNMWMASEPVIENGSFREGSYRAVKRTLFKDFIYGVLFTAGETKPRSAKEIEKELRSLDLDSQLLNTSKSEAIQSECKSFEELAFSEPEDAFAIQIQWWIKTNPSEIISESFEHVWIKCITGSFVIHHADGKKEEALPKGAAKLISSIKGAKISSNDDSIALVLRQNKMSVDNSSQFS